MTTALTVWAVWDAAILTAALVVLVLDTHRTDPDNHHRKASSDDHR